MPPPIDDKARPRLARGVRLQIDCRTGKGVLLFPEGIIELNETAQEILTRCDGRSLGEIVSGLTEEYEIDPLTIATDIQATLVELQAKKLVELQ